MRGAYPLGRLPDNICEPIMASTVIVFDFIFIAPFKLQA
jgi:hypothetical protein